MPVEFVLTESTCSDACWHAREVVCRCSCGGKNHGCLSSSDGERPVRTAKIDGDRYELKLVTNSGYEARNLAQQLCLAAGTRVVTYPSGRSYTTRWSETDKGAPARMKTASRDQVEKWPELTGYGTGWRRVYLVWAKVA